MKFRVVARERLSGHFPLGLSALLWSSFGGTPAALGQGYVLLEFNGTTPGEGNAMSVAGAGDVNGDGLDDVIVGWPFASPPGVPCCFAGRATVYSGGTGQPVPGLTLDGTAPGETLGFAVAGAGDVDGDGAGDVVVGTPNAAPGGISGAGQAFVFSGATGLQVPGLVFSGTTPDANLGRAVAGPGDLDGDGLADLLVGIPQASVPGIGLAGRARVYSGATGLPLPGLAFDGSASSDQFGWSVSGAGDVNGDGVPDILVGSPSANPGGLADAGRATVFSGSNGAALLVLNGPNAGAFFGYSVSGVGDVDGDGASDLIVGAPALGAPFLGFGTARVFSGASGTALFTFSGSVNNAFGRSVDGAGDMDGDLVPDFVVGWPIASPPGLDLAGQAKVLSGATGATLLVITGTPGDEMGSAVAGAGDTNGDGFAEVILAAEGADPPGVPCCNAGRARVVSLVGVPPGSSLFGSGCAGSGGAIPAITTSGGTPTSAGNPNFRVQVGNALGGTIALLVAGLSNTSWNGNPLPLNLGGIGVPACSLFVSPDFFFGRLTSGTGAADGIATVSLPVPANPALAGGALYLQWYVYDPFPFFPIPGAMSQALQVVIQ